MAIFADSAPAPVFDAVILAEGESATRRVAGVGLGERGRLVAERVGARRVCVMASADDRSQLASWWSDGGDGALLVIRAGDQLVHMPLAAPLVAADDDRNQTSRRYAVSPEGDYAGALWANPGAAPQVIAELAAGTSDHAIVRAWTDAAPIEHGAVACHPAGTDDERRQAARWLFQIIHKDQDGPVTRYLYRPISLPLTRLLLHTPVRPNHVSIAVAVLGAIGVYFTAHYAYSQVVLGSAIILLAGYLDGCDGEIARLKLQSSKLGAWLDTVTDETTTVLYVGALGWHCYLHHPAPWLAATIVYGVTTYIVDIYIVYFYLIVIADSANSQDYQGQLNLVPGLRPGTLTLEPKPKTARRGPRLWLRFTDVAIHIARRDFINWAALILAALHWTYLSYTLFILGATGSALVMVREHVALRRQLHAIALAQPSA